MEENVFMVEGKYEKIPEDELEKVYNSIRQDPKKWFKAAMEVNKNFYILKDEYLKLKDERDSLEANLTARIGSEDDWKN